MECYTIVLENFTTVEYYTIVLGNFTTVSLTARHTHTGLPGGAAAAADMPSESGSCGWVSGTPGVAPSSPPFPLFVNDISYIKHIHIT